MYGSCLLIHLVLATEELKKEAMHYIICLLPKVNIDSLAVLCWFMTVVASFYIPPSLADSQPGGNKMDLENLAVVLAPNILVSKSKNVLDDDSFVTIQAVEILLKYQADFWMVVIVLG